MKSFLVLSTLLTFGAVSACSSTPLSVGTDHPGSDGGSGDDQTDGGEASDAHGTGTCTTDTDCGSAGICGFLESQSCAATGTCFPMPQATCAAISYACACDGTTYNVACTGLPSGYVPKPFLHRDACADAAPPPQPSACNVDSDCGPKRICGYPQADVCAAKGQCFPQPEGTCDAFVPGCGCDGTLVMIGCNGLPDGYAAKPVAHAGQCDDAGK
jgi:hypothetical protein